ncbi:BTAD domain-containing putative transcriptional regulator [Actinomycetospora sp. C-140]
MPRYVLRRPRLDRQLDALFHGSRVVAVTAAPGSGKTVQAQLYAETCGRPVHWVTLSSVEKSGPRLVSALAGALRARRRPEAGLVAETSVRVDFVVEESAAHVAHAVPATPALLVVDECEHVEASAEALAVLDTFVEYTPENLWILLLTRGGLAGPLRRRMLGEQVQIVDGDDLRLTVDENSQLADLLGVSPEHADAVMAATGGWTAGAAFGHRYGLSDHHTVKDLPWAIMDDLLVGLPHDEREFLLDSSIPRVVTRDIATALCGRNVHGLWDSIRGRHLPATTTTDGTIMYHALFRSFLHRELLARDPGRYEELVLRYATHLAAGGQHEDATEAYLSVGALDQAAGTAERAAPGLCERADWATFTRWSDRLGPDRIERHPVLLAATVRAMFGCRRFEETIETVRLLDRSGTLRAATEADPALLAVAAWALQARPAEARSLLQRYQGDFRADVVAYMVEVCGDVVPATPRLGTDWADVERVMTWTLFLQGRVGDLRKYIPDDLHVPVLNPNVILAPTLLGDLETARALWRRVPPEVRARPHSRFIESFLLLYGGDPRRALDAIEAALTDSRHSNFHLRPAYQVFSGLVLLQLGRLEDATALLRQSVEQTTAAGHIALREWAQAFHGLALLKAGETETARSLLGASVRSMSGARRRLFLPLAAVCLAEAEARCGRLEAAREAADIAYQSSTTTGSFAGILTAVRALPDVLDREGGPEPGLRWRRLLVSPSARPVADPVVGRQAHLVLQPFGTHRDIVVAGVAQNIGRLKIVELLAYLVLHPHGVDRGRLQSALFPDATLRNGGNHFRQVAFKFKQLTGLSLARGEQNTVGLPGDVVVEAADLRFESLVGSASSAVGPERIARLRAALDLVEGPYLASSNLIWVEERRNHLEIVQEEARLELVRLLIEAAELERARDECEALLALNRFSDPAYRLLAQIERRIGSESSVLATYRRAVASLEELGLEPGDARRLLVDGRALGA